MDLNPVIPLQWRIMDVRHSQGTPFLKMHGLGNDFVVLDGRRTSFVLNALTVRTIADRHVGVGCDQLIVLMPPRTVGADVFMSIHNADGSEVAACGNATRCVGALLMEELGRGAVMIETRSGLLRACRKNSNLVTVEMGAAQLDWRAIPLTYAVDTLHLPLRAGPLADAVGVSLGNPHAVFFVAMAEAVDLAAVGPLLEHDALFPERTNIEVVQALGMERLRVRVWERGVGITRACGTGACAAVVAAVRRGLLPGRQAEVVLDGGSLFIIWNNDGGVTMTGPATVSFTGILYCNLGSSPQGDSP